MVLNEMSESVDFMRKFLDFNDLINVIFQKNKKKLFIIP